jgi:flagellar basal-body rod modification protein FlgD
MALEGVQNTDSASMQQMDFMNLLITQMQNQNPLEPMSNQDMAAQLAQFSQLQMSEDMNGNISTMNSTMEKLNSSFQGSLLMAEYDYARNLLGKEVSFYEEGQSAELTGMVSKVNIDKNTGYSHLEVDVKDFALPNGQKVTDTYQLPLNGVTGIGQPIL